MGDEPVDDEPQTPRASGDRRPLAQPPSARYAPRPTEAAAAREAGDPRRAWALALAAAGVGAAAIVVLAGVFAVSFGLLVVAYLIGRIIGIQVRTAMATRSTPLRPAAAAVLAVGSVSLGLIGVWLYAGSEGGVLPLGEYLGQTFGPVVLLQAAVAGAAAWWSARQPGVPADDPSIG